MRRVRLGRALGVGAVLTMIVASGGLAGGATEVREVRIAGLQFSPSGIDVEVDGRVVWRNEDDVPHTVTFDDGEFDSHPSCVALVGFNCMSPNSDVGHTFSRAGEYSYYCKVHPAMSGSVRVSERSAGSV